MAVYFIECSALKAIKIGYADSPAKRLANLQTASPAKLKMLGYVDGGLSDEKRFHRALIRHRVRGEWFRDCDEVRDVIGDALKDGNIPDAIRDVSPWEIREAICDQVLSSLSPFLLRRLAREIAMTAEKSYRRGYHQGYVVATDDHDSYLSQSIAMWRSEYASDMPKGAGIKAVAPPEPRMPRERDFNVSIYMRAGWDSAGSVGAHVVAAIINEVESSLAVDVDDEPATARGEE